VTSIEVPYELLDRAILPSMGQSGEGDSWAERVAPAQTLAGSLQQAIEPLLPYHLASLELAAELAETSPRTLERRLAEEHTSWRHVVDRARLEICLRMLRNTDHPLAAIAHEVGYSDQAHLTRAIRRWTGESPSDYRRRRN
jgi:AraC-like DNA-binding protein